MTLKKKIFISLLKTWFQIKLMDKMTFLLEWFKLCGKSLAYPSNLLFQSSLEKGIFPVDWNKSNIVLVYKKNENVIKNYQPVSLLPIFNKIYERLILDSIFNYFMKIICLLKVNQASCPVAHVFLSYHK